MDRSIPPLMMTKVSPVANNRRVVAARIILEKFLRPKKFFPRILKRMSMHIRKSRAQFLATWLSVFLSLFLCIAEGLPVVLM